MVRGTLFSRLYATVRGTLFNRFYATVRGTLFNWLYATARGTLFNRLYATVRCTSFNRFVWGQRHMQCGTGFLSVRGTVWKWFVCDNRFECGHRHKLKPALQWNNKSYKFDAFSVLSFGWEQLLLCSSYLLSSWFCPFNCNFSSNICLFFGPAYFCCVELCSFRVCKTILVLHIFHTRFHKHIKTEFTLKKALYL